MAVLYHGTSSVHMDGIKAEGLKNPYLAASYSLAQYYAEVTAEEDGGEPVVLVVNAPSSNLRMDYAAVAEPVGYDQFSIDDLKTRVERTFSFAKLQHPGWVKDGVILIPSELYGFSLDTVGSCRFAGVIPVTGIRNFQTEYERMQDIASGVR